MKKIFALVFLVFSTMIYSAPPIIVDQNTGEYLGNLGAQDSSNNPTQYKIKYMQDSRNSRNNPMAHHGNYYVQDGMNKRNNPGGKYYVPQKLNNPASSNVTGPHETAVTIQIKDW